MTFIKTVDFQNSNIYQNSFNNKILYDLKKISLGYVKNIEKISFIVKSLIIIFYFIGVKFCNSALILRFFGVFASYIKKMKSRVTQGLFDIHLIDFRSLTLTRPIGLPPHAPGAQKVAEQCTLIASLVKRLFVPVDWTERLRDDSSTTD